MRPRLRRAHALRDEHCPRGRAARLPHPPRRVPHPPAMRPRKGPGDAVGTTEAVAGRLPAAAAVEAAAVEAAAVEAVEGDGADGEGAGDAREIQT